MKTKKLLMALTFLCLIFGVASCGDGSDSDGEATSTFTLKGSDS